ncbi:DUF2479 domain-containing protein [Clostridium perfringens]|nr:DUF2479 domain-containing protein [Clostridium perfringens]
MAIYFTQNTNSVEDIEQMNNVIDKVNKVNTEATSNIGQLTDLNNKAQELSNNIQEALPINTELKENIKIGQPLVQEATTKNTELQASLEKTKKFIDGLDGSQNIPGIRMELTELQNGLKSNQSLEYSGSSITANDTLEGRTEGMRIGGRTLQNVMPELNKSNFNFTGETNLVDGFFVIPFGVDVNASLIGVNRKKSILKPNTKYTIIADILENDTGQKLGVSSYGCSFVPSKNSFENSIGISMITGTTKNNFNDVEIKTDFLFCIWGNGGDLSKKIKFKAMVLEGDWTDKPIPNFFEGLKSFGEAEQEGDKYKISILSSNSNLVKIAYKEEVNGSNGKFTESNIFFRTDFIKSNNKTYYLKTLENYRFTNIYLYDANKNYIGRGSFSSVDSLSPQSDYFILSGRKEDRSPLDSDFKKKICITESKIDEFIENIHNKKDILIKEPLREGDYLYEDNEQVKVYRDGGKYVFTGNENMYIEETIAANNIKFVITTEGTDIKPAGKVICNKFIQGNDTIANSVRLGTSNKVVINIQSSTLESPNMGGFRKWLKDNPTEIIYQLATPTVEVVENCVDIDLDTFIEKTYFNILNSLPGTLDFKVPSNIASIVQNTAREVNNIWDVINNLLVPSLIDINKNVAMATIKNNLK